MAGKPKNSKWGGTRAGAGAKKKKKDVSESIKNNYVKAAEELSKEHGMTVEKALLSMIFDDDIQDTVKASIMKTYNEAMISKESLQNISVTKNQGMAVRLPPKKEDPALKVVKG